MRSEIEPKKMLKKNRWDVLGQRHVLGQREGGEGHTSYDSLPKGACRLMQNCANYLARRGDLLRRAADLQASPHAADPPCNSHNYSHIVV